MDFLENIDIDRGILKNIDIDKICIDWNLAYQTGLIRYEKQLHNIASCLSRINYLIWSQIVEACERR